MAVLTLGVLVTSLGAAWAGEGDTSAASAVAAEAGRWAVVRALEPLDPPPAAVAGAALAMPSLPRPEPSPTDERPAVAVARVGRIELPTLGVADDMFEGVTLTAIDQGPSHWPGTAMPGKLGNVVVAGHRTTHTRPFEDLDRLRPGDPLVLSGPDGAAHTYRLDRLEIVDDSALHIVDQGWARTATLFACHPKGSARQRIVAHFSLVEPDGS